MLLFKAHPNFAKIAPRNRTWSNIRVLAGSEDLYQVLPACDVLITDYSSVAFDFLVLDRPVVYFVPDHERYLRHRNVYFSFDEMAVGPVITTCDDLYALLAAPFGVELDRAKHDQVTELVWSDSRGNAIPRIIDFIRSGGSDIDAPQIAELAGRGGPR
jgi:CDP-glycerol glycerophosphotransferase (TagB/SpsB family)